MPPHWSTWTPLQDYSHTLDIFRWPDGVSTGTDFNLYGSSLTPLTHPLPDYFSWRCSPTLPIIIKFPTKLSLHGYDRLACHELFHTKYALLHGPTFHCSLNPRPHGTQPPLSATPPTTHTSSIADSKWVTLNAAPCIKSFVLQFPFSSQLKRSGTKKWIFWSI
jgi:hypothetical protein